MISSAGGLSPARRLAPSGSLAAIAEEVASLHGLTVAELKSRTRRRRISHPRQQAMAMMRLQRRPDGSQRYSCRQIANFFGLKDHTTVVYAVRIHQARAGASA